MKKKPKLSTTARRHWQPKEVEMLIRLWTQGYEPREIAKYVQRTPAVVRAKAGALRKSGCKLPSNSRYAGGRLDAAKVKAIKKDKRTLSAIALDYGVSAVTIHRVRKNMTWVGAH